MDNERRKEIIEIWKTVVEVQKHFNDIAMRIRSLFITMVLATAAAQKAYPVDSGHARCCVLNDRILPVVGTNINGQGAFAFPIPEGVF